MYNDSIVGDLINFRGLVYSPMNENGVIFLFGKVMEDLNMYVEEIKPGYPDCIARRYTGKGWKKIRIEFEFASSNFKQHKHDIKNCDIIVCWVNDWKDCPLEVIELKSYIKTLENHDIEKPNDEISDDTEKARSFLSYGSDISINLYNKIKEKILAINEDIYENIGSLFCSFNSPERAFCFIRLFKSSIRVRFFTGGKVWENATKIQDKWGEYSIKDSETLEKASLMINEAYKLIKLAIKRNEQTGLYSKIPQNED